MGKSDDSELPVKTVLLGYAFTGKTCLVARFAHDRFYKTEAVSTTLYVNQTSCAAFVDFCI